MELKDENLTIHEMQKTSKNITMMQFYNEIKWIYLNYDLNSIISFIIDVISLPQTLNKLQQQDQTMQIKQSLSKNVLEYDLIVMLRLLPVDKYIV